MAELRRTRVVAIAVALACGLSSVTAQTRIVPPKNKYTPEQDVELGQKAAAEVRAQYPVITNPEIQRYMTHLGQSLVEAAPPELNNPAFRYSFTPVNVKEINAFALPGGPMFINRGMIDSAHSEGEVVGVMAHELSHVLLRHGTANATKAQGFQLGALAGMIAGAVVGGGVGSIISQGSQLGLGTWLLRYSREYEKQADILGAQLMARAGYDPRDLARVFENIEKQGGAGSPQWMSDHPNPGNRSQYIEQEASMLQIASVRHDTGDLERAKQLMAQLPPPMKMADVEKNAQRGGGNPRGGGGNGNTQEVSVGQIGEPVPLPSSDYRTVRGGKVVQLSVPSNWQALSSTNSIKFVPQNGYGPLNGQTVFTHGAEVGVVHAQTRDLGAATDALLDSLQSSNPAMEETDAPRETRLSQRTAIVHRLVNRSATGAQERVDITTTLLSDGSLFYYVTVVPSSERDAYDPAFRKIADSIQLTDQ